MWEGSGGVFLEEPVEKISETVGASPNCTKEDEAHEEKRRHHRKEVSFKFPIWSFNLKFQD